MIRFFFHLPASKADQFYSSHYHWNLQTRFCFWMLTMPINVPLIPFQLSFWNSTSVSLVQSSQILSVSFWRNFSIVIQTSSCPVSSQKTISIPGWSQQLSSNFKPQLHFLFFHIRALRHIRASLTTEASETKTAAIVGSRLDFCNFLLAGTSVSNLTRLQLVQNTLARVVAQKPRFCLITPVFFWFALASGSPQN